jgi:hypothetical protein
VAKRCPYCGQVRIRLLRGGRFLTYWHPLGPLLGYRRCTPELAARYRDLTTEADAEVSS